LHVRTQSFDVLVHTKTIMALPANIRLGMKKTYDEQANLFSATVSDEEKKVL